MSEWEYKELHPSSASDGGVNETGKSHQRRQRRRRRLRVQALDGQKRVGIHCFAQRLDEMIVSRALDRNGYTFTFLNEDVIHGKYGAANIYVFVEIGTLVVWGATVRDEKFILKQLEAAIIDTEDLFEVQSDDFDYVLSDQVQELRIERDVLVLPVLENEDLLSWQLSCSYALATSVKLGVVEDQIENVIEDCMHIPRELATEGKVVSLTKKEVSCLIGKLFMHKSSVNLLHDILDAPSYFWDRPILEEVYSKCRQHVEIDRRVDVLNQRFEVLNELLQILQNEKSESHSKQLEWIVIWLIIIEVIIGIVEITFMATNDGSIF